MISSVATLDPSLKNLVDDLTAKAESLFRQDGFEQCLELSEQTLALSCAGDITRPLYKHGMLHSLIYIAKCKSYTGPLFDLIESLKGVIKLLDENDDPRLRCTAYIAMGSIYQFNGDPAISRSYTQRALVIAESNHYLYELGEALLVHAKILMLSKERDETQAILSRCRTIAQDIGNARLASGALNDLAMLWLSKGRLKQAESVARDAVQLAPSLTLRSIFIDSLACVLQAKGDLPAAERLFKEAIHLNESEQGAIQRIESYINLGNLYLRMQKFSDAKTTLTIGLRLAEENGVLAYSRLAHKSLADLYDRTGDVANAYHHFHIFHQQTEKLTPTDTFANMMNVMIAHTLDTAQREAKPRSARRPHPVTIAPTELGQLAATDPLTGILTQAQFLAQNTDAFFSAKQKRLPLTVALFKVTDFEKINTIHGRLTGDRVLAAVSQLLISSARLGDQCGRYQQEQFAMLLTKTDASIAKHFSERICATAANFSVQSDAGPVRFSLQFAIVTLQPEDESLQQILERAEAAFPSSKRVG